MFTCIPSSQENTKTKREKKKRELRTDSKTGEQMGIMARGCCTQLEAPQLEVPQLEVPSLGNPLFLGRAAAEPEATAHPLDVTI